MSKEAKYALAIFAVIAAIATVSLILRAQRMPTVVDTTKIKL